MEGGMALALAMAEDGIAIYAQRFRREHPGCAEAEVDQAVAEWLARRPADAPGRVVSWPRH
jgi:hypothetical protein